MGNTRFTTNCELATLRGKLVHVRDAGGRTAHISVTAGDRDCEMMWLEELRIARM